MNPDDFELARGWLDATRGVAFSVHESRAWREGWRLWRVRQQARRRFASSPRPFVSH